MASSVTRLTVSKLIFFLCLTYNFNCGCLVFAANSNKLLLRWKDSYQSSELRAGSLVLTHVPSSVSFRSTAGSIKLRDVPRVISLALGFSSLQDVEWKGLLAGNIFNRPKANVLFIIEGLQKESFCLKDLVVEVDVVDLKVPYLQNLYEEMANGNALSFSSTSRSYPIVKSEAESYLDIFHISPLRNFVSHISNVLMEKPLVVSFSAEKQLAQAASAAGLNAHTISWDATEKSFKNSNPSKDDVISREELLKKFENEGLGKDVKYRNEDGKFVVSVPGMSDTSFDMSEEEEFLFFAELKMIQHLYEKVKTLDDQLHDKYPDFYTFGISSLKGLSRRYGADSNQVVAALHVLNSFVPQVSALFTDLYGGQALVEVVNLERESDGDNRFSKETKAVYEHVQDHLQSRSYDNFNENLPEVNLRENLEDQARAKICESVRNKLFAMQSKLEVSCGDFSGERHRRYRREVGQPGATKTDCKNVHNLALIGDYYDSEFPAIFNISLWLMITLVLALYVVSLVLWYMDPGRDSVIYRVTSQRMKTD